MGLVDWANVRRRAGTSDLFPGQRVYLLVSAGRVAEIWVRMLRDEAGANGASVVVREGHVYLVLDEG